MSAIENGRLILTDEDLRIVANTEQFYDALVADMRRLNSLPRHLAWKTVRGQDYLYQTLDGAGTPKSLGPRSPETETQMSDYFATRQDLESRIQTISQRLSQSLAQYRALRLPQIMSLPGKLLRELDVRGHLGTDFIVVGTNAFAAYEIESRERFAHGLDETEDFDLGWCRGSSISLNASTKLVGSPLLSALKAIDPSFRMGNRKYQAINKDAYEVELLAAPSVVKTLSQDEVFSPLPLPEQEWLLKGTPVRHVVCARDGSPAPLVVPDPRWMGLHKLWLSQKESRKATKKDKDAKQGDLLLEAVARKMQTAYPMNVDFVLSLPEELLPVFNEWAARRSFVPQSAAAQGWWNNASS